MAAPANTEAANGAAQHSLAQIDALAGEIGTAIRAIGGNALPALEQSIERQGELAAGLGLALARLRVAGLDSGGTPLPPELSSRLREGARSLARLNDEYAALLKHSGHSLRLLLAVHGREAGQKHRGQDFRVEPLRQQNTSWEG